MSPLQAATEPFRDLVDESFDEAAFLWRRWESELTSLTRNLDEIWSWTEDRLHGALDGVRVAGAGSIGPATKALRSGDVDRMTVGAAMLASSQERRALDVLTRALTTANDEKLRAILRALELCGSDQALRAAASVFATPEPRRAAALCRLKAFRRVAPSDQELTTAFASVVPEMQVEAIRAARLITSGSADKLINAALDSADAMVRYAAVESGMCLGMSRAWEVAIRLARQRTPEAGPYLNLLAMFGTANEHEPVYSALRVSELQSPAIRALGHLGTVRAAEACLAGIVHEPLARACGEAYCWMTGADLVRDRLAADEPPVDAPTFEDDNLDANLVPPAEALWPLPDAEAVRKHWLALRANWTPDVRYARGRPANGETLLAAIETGPMLRRPDLVLELRVKTRGRYDVETRAFAARQRQMMAAARAAAANHGGR